MLPCSGHDRSLTATEAAAAVVAVLVVVAAIVFNRDEGERFRRFLNIKSRFQDGKLSPEVAEEEGVVTSPSPPPLLANIITFRSMGDKDFMYAMSFIVSLSRQDELNEIN